MSIQATPKTLEAKYEFEIPPTHCINICMWVDPDHKDLHKWKEYERGMSSMETGADSMESATRIVNQGLGMGYTHFVLSYPVAMMGPSTRDNPHGIMWRPQPPAKLTFWQKLKNLFKS